MPLAATQDVTSTLPLEDNEGPSERHPARCPTLVIAWAAGEPWRAGQILAPGPGAIPYQTTFGRGGPAPGQGARLLLFTERPGELSLAPPLENKFISRDQLRILAEPNALLVRNIGRCPMRVGDQVVHEAEVEPGDTLELKGQLLLLCVARPPNLPPCHAFPTRDFPPFGEADPCGIVGESPAAWTLREQLAFIGKRQGHVLLLGPSGAGKELCADALHLHSPRRDRPRVSRNAATLPPGIVDAELFGNARNYPNPGMQERPGLVGEADGSTLLLDEIGELPLELQAHLLRLLDQGEYQRLGEARARRADVRVIAATNRPVDELKHDLGARFRLRVSVPGLNERREDVPLLARHLLRQIAAREPDIGARFFEGWDGHRGEPRISLRLVRALVSHPYTTHVRELERMLWSALVASRGATIERVDDAPREARAEARAEEPSEDREISAEVLQEALARHGGVMERVWRELGLRNRHVLRRLLAKHGIEVAPHRDDPH